MGGATLLIKGGIVYDGSGAPPRKADIAFSGDEILYIGTKPSGAERTIEATGLAVAPGLIDVHGHSEFTVLADPRAEGKVLQGVTTEINGNCGLSGGPMLGEARHRREEDLKEYGISERWEGLGEFLSLVEQRSPALNFATLAGHGSIRASVMGYSPGEPSAKQIDRMEGLLSECMAEGAFGLSSGLIYPPGIFSSTGELAELARRGRDASPSGFLYASHIRGEGDRLLDAVAEAIEIGRTAGVHVHISHLKTAGRENWRKAQRVVELIEEARTSGLEVTCDRYPYTASATELDSVLPEWAFAGGAVEELRQLRDPLERQRMKQEMPDDRELWEGVVISEVRTEEARWMEGRSIAELADMSGRDFADTVMEVLVQEGLRVGAVFHAMSEENLKLFLSLPYAMLGSDSSARSLSGVTARGRPHPRGFGSFPRFLGRKDFTLEEAIRKVTSLPARTFGLLRRGLLKEGFKADVVVFDPERISDRATYEDPFVKPDGVPYVIVNGEVTVTEGILSGNRAGRVLRRGQ